MKLSEVNWTYSGVTATIALLFTFVNIFFTLRQNAFNNKRMVDRERPEILPQSISLPDFNLDGKPIAILKFVNVGASPAYNIKIERTFSVEYFGAVPVHPPDTIQTSADSSLLTPYPIAPKGEIQIPIHGPLQIANPHFWDVVLNDELSNYRLVVYGVVSYEDREGNKFPSLKYNYSYLAEPKVLRTVKEFNKFVGDPFKGVWISYPVYNK